jgi:hypothetical protein
MSLERLFIGSRCATLSILLSLLNSPAMAVHYICPEKFRSAIERNAIETTWLVHDAFPDAPRKSGEFKFRSSWTAFLDRPNEIRSPDVENKSGDTEIYISLFPPGRNIVVSCAYSGTHLVLFHKLPDNLSQCTHTVSATGKKQASNIVECQ